MLIVSSCDKIGTSSKYDVKKLIEIEEKLANIGVGITIDETKIIMEEYVEIMEKHLESRKKWEKFKNAVKKYDELNIMEFNANYDEAKNTIEEIKKYVLN